MDIGCERHRTLRPEATGGSGETGRHSLKPAIGSWPRKASTPPRCRKSASLADVGAGTVYNYFASKDELAMCVMEQVMDRLSQRIEAVTNSFTDPAQVYAFGIRTVMKAATTDQRWRWLLRRSEVISDAMYRVMGP